MKITGTRSKVDISPFSDRPRRDTVLQRTRGFVQCTNNSSDKTYYNVFYNTNVSQDEQAVVVQFYSDSGDDSSVFAEVCHLPLSTPEQAVC
jgi:hypothetical protein